MPILLDNPNKLKLAMNGTDAGNGITTYMAFVLVQFCLRKVFADTNQISETGKF